MSDFHIFFPWRLPLSLANLWKWFEVPVFVLLPRHQWVGKVWRRKVNIERNHKGEGWRNFRGKCFQTDIITWHLNQDFTNKNYKYVSICDHFQTFENWLELFVCPEFNFSLKSWELNVEGGWSVAKSEFNSQNVRIVWILDQFHIFDSVSQNCFGFSTFPASPDQIFSWFVRVGIDCTQYFFLFVNWLCWNGGGFMAQPYVLLRLMR